MCTEKDDRKRYTYLPLCTNVKNKTNVSHTIVKYISILNVINLFSLKLFKTNLPLLPS